MLCHTTAMVGALWMGGSWRPPSIGHIDHETLPLRCHWEQEADAGRCEDMLTYAAEAWQAQVDGLGFQAPILDDEGLLQLYLYQESAGGAFTTCTRWADAVAGDGLSSCPTYIAFARSISTRDMASYVAHEFNHALQFATDYNEPTLPIWEGVATSAEQWTYPDTLEPTMYYLADYQAAPWAGLLNDGYFLWDEHELWSFYEYGSALWVLHLDHHYGDGQGSAGPALWAAAAQEGLPNKPDVIDAYDAVTGDWREALLSLTAERALVGTDRAPAWADFTTASTQIALEAELTLADLPATVVPAVMPYATGAIYVHIEEVPANTPLRFSVTTPADSAWGVVAVGETDMIWEEGTTLTWDQPGPVTFAVVNLDHDNYALSGNTVTLRESQRDISLQIALLSDGLEDSGQTDEDSGDSNDDEGKRACGCASASSGGGGGGAGGAAGGLWALALLWARRRTRR